MFGYGVIDLNYMHNNNNMKCSHNMTHKCRHLLNKLIKEHHNIQALIVESTEKNSSEQL